MILYLLRHANAMDKNSWDRSDFSRPLTKEGVMKMKKVAKIIRRLGLDLDGIITSPYRRAYDTAMIFAKRLKLKKHLKISRFLSPDGDPRALIRRLRERSLSLDNVLLVGHDPYLSRLLGVLIAGDCNAGLTMAKGGLAKLTTDSLAYGKCATLEWLLTPKILISDE
jgi:phosphohistidine phosphatase